MNPIKQISRPYKRAAVRTTTDFEEKPRRKPRSFLSLLFQPSLPFVDSGLAGWLAGWLSPESDDSLTKTRDPMFYIQIGPKREGALNEREQYPTLIHSATSSYAKFLPPPSTPEVVHESKNYV